MLFLDLAMSIIRFVLIATWFYVLQGNVKSMVTNDRDAHSIITDMAILMILCLI